MAEKKKYNSILISGRKDETLTYTKYIKDEESGESVKESLDKKVNVTDKLETQQIKDGAITNEKMAAGSVGNTNLQDGSVSNEKLEDGSITNEKLAENSITKDKLKDNTIGVEKLDPELRQTINAATGLPENLVETIQNVDDTLKDHQRQLDDKQSQIDDKQQQITANDEDISLLQTRSTQMEETIKGIAATGGASQATAVTYDNKKSGLDAVNIQSAIDEIINNLGNYETNEEWLRAYTDKEGKFLWGIRIDGSIDWSIGIPTPIRIKLQEIVIKCQQDKTDLTESIATSKEELTSSLQTYQQTTDANIATLQEGKVDKEEGKSLIEDEVKECFRVIENEEFIKAIVDAEDRVLFGIYRDTGKPYYPQNDMYHISQSEEFLWVILDAANHPLLGIQQDGTCWAAKAQWLDDIKAIKEALSSIDETLKTLKTFQPKEDGKGLINLDVADSFFYISNNEYIIAVEDAENRILAGIKYDGQPYFPNHEMYSVITYEEWLYAIIDAEEKVLCGFRADDGHMIIGGIDISTFISDAIIDISDIKERTSHLSTIINDEYLSIETDVDGKVIGYIAPDGSHYLYKVKSETIPEEFFHIEDPEGRTEITTDAENKIIGYRDSEGTRHEHKISAKHLELSDEAAKEVNEAFNSAGIKMENPSDFSKDSHIELPIPRIAAQVKIYAPKLPTTKQDNIEAEIEYNDKDGNYFRKPIILNAQGSSSMGYYVKNMAIDIADGSEIKFGDFPTQDSFHLKKYYIDSFRGQCIVCYWLMEQVYKSHPLGQQYPYEYLIKNESTTDSNGNVKKDFFIGAKCHPDGFPIIITWINSVNGEETWMGIYAWNLKKSKEVYYADKKKAENIILDGVINFDSLFGGSIIWEDFEIRNPKGLIDIDGNKYDGDNPKELSDTDEFSRKVKGYIKNLSNIYTELDASDTKETFEKHFLVEPFIDYYLVSQVIYHHDGFSKNWIWQTLDGQHWAPNLYDVDSVFGSHWEGAYVIPNSDKEGILGNVAVMHLNTLYKEEIKQRYAQLRNKGIFSADNIIALLNKWVGSIGYDNYKKEFEVYNETPSYRANNLSDGWKLIGSYTYSISEYVADKQYQKGEKVSYYNYEFEATKAVQGVPPVTKLYGKKPFIYGYYNSVGRVKNWLTNRISYLDTYYEFKNI